MENCRYLPKNDCLHVYSPVFEIVGDNWPSTASTAQRRDSRDRLGFKLFNQI